MTRFRQQRLWFWIAIAAIAIALAALLVPHVSGPSSHTEWLATLPVLFIGLITPLSLLLTLLSVLSLGHTPQAPALAASFQRPPPFRA